MTLAAFGTMPTAFCRASKSSFVLPVAFSIETDERRCMEFPFCDLGGGIFLLLLDPFSKNSQKEQTGLYILSSNKRSPYRLPRKNFSHIYFADSRIAFAASPAVFAGSDVCCMQAVTMAPSIIKLIAGR